MRTRTPTTALLIVLGLLATACSGSDQNSDTTVGTAPPVTTTTTSTTAATTTTTTPPVPPLVVWTDPRSAEALAGYGADFRAETGIPVEIVPMPVSEIDDAVLSDPGAAPDVFAIGHRSLPALVDGGLVAEIELPQPARFQVLAVEAFTSGDAVYALPYALESPALYRNTELVAEAPQTYTDLVSACEKLEEGKRCIGIPADDPEAHLAIVNAYGGYAFAHGEDGFDPSDVGLDGDGALRAAEFVDAEVAAGRLHPAIGADAAAELFSSGTLAFLFSTPLDDPGIDEWDTQALRPRESEGQAAVLADAYGFAVSATTDRPDAAERFLFDYVAERHVMFDLFLAGGRPPAMTQAYDDAVATDPRVASFNPDSADPAVIYPPLPEMETLLGAFANALGVIFEQSYDETVPDAETAFTQAAAAIRDMLADG